MNIPIAVIYELINILILFISIILGTKLISKMNLTRLIRNIRIENDENTPERIIWLIVIIFIWAYLVTLRIVLTAS